MRSSFKALVATVAGLALAAAGCGSDDTGAAVEADTERPTVVVTTNILGDVVENLVGDAFDVVTIMPVGADPHDFQASAQQVAQIGEADVLIVNGGGFEEGLLDVIEAAEGDGVLVFEALSAVDTIEFGESGRGTDEHDDEHDREDADPHFWTDPGRMALAAEAIAVFLVANVDGVDADALDASADAYVAELEALDTEVAEALAPIGEDRRVLVTNHDALGYFADRYDFEVAGTVIPSGSTTDGTSARELAELTEVIRDEGVLAIFAETTVSDELAQTLADEVGDEIAVVDLYTGSLGESGSDAASYVTMMRTNAQRIVDALAG
ncbi:MAG: zinc ABC transporter substrate-binding protein [Acidimicrobiales bacterium]|nr:zinc ABC transporter substrate-binding protein [Acidimicrobiales bacterium]